MTRSRAAILGLWGAVCLGATTFGQSASPPFPASGAVTPVGQEPNFGITGYSSSTAPALEFAPRDPSTTWGFVASTPDRYLIAGLFEAPMHFPQGALVSIIEIEGCDNSTTGGLFANFNTAAGPAGSTVPLGSISSGTTAAPGCGWFPVVLSSPFVVSNANNVYWFELLNSPGDGSAYFAAARAYYKLQVSTPPVTPTFSDVPSGDSAYPFVEAFVAAGITVGCDTGPPARYCPDDTVTRRQMAVFFAKALGLYFPN